MSDLRPTEHPIEPQFTERWSPRSFTGEPLPEATLLGLLEAARWAPSASNLQPWRFLYGLAGTPAFQDLVDALVPFNQTWAARASALIVVMSRTTAVAAGQTEAKANPWHAFDAGAAWMNLALQAHAAGLSAHAMGGFSADALRERLAIPADVAVHAVVAVGRRGDKAQLPEALQAREQPNGRLPLAQVAAAGRWSFEA